MASEDWLDPFMGRGSANCLAAVAEAVDDFAGKGYDVHTIKLELNGQHGEFDLTVLATNSDMEDCEMTALAFRSGGVENIHVMDGVSV